MSKIGRHRGDRLGASSDTVATTFFLQFSWWTHPAWAASVFVAILPIASSRPVQEAFSVWKVPRYIDLGLALTGVISGLAFIVGVVAASGNKHPKRVSVVLTDRAILRLQILARLMYAGALFGYVAWVSLSLIRGASPSDFLNVIALRDGAIGDLKRISPPVAGITTLTQLGVIATTIMTILRRSGRGNYSVQLSLLLILALLRSFFYGERLAIIEVILPLILVYLTVESVEGTRTRMSYRDRFHLPKSLIPFLMLPALWGLFALFEYSRSWLYYRQVVNASFVEYVSTRLLGYYTTTINNGALYHSLLDGQQYDSYFSFAFAWDAPIFGSFLGSPEILGSAPREWWANSLQNYANPEFNNEGTFLITDADLGTPLSALYWLLLGLLVGAVYSRARRGDVRYLIAYCVLFIGLLEISRINYWTQGRFIPIVLGLIFVAFYLAPPTRVGARYG